MTPLIITLAANLLFVAQVLIILIITTFMPLSAISFFKAMLPKKEKDYQKAMHDMGINTSRRVRDYYAPIRYALPVAFVSLICLLAALFFAFNDSESISDSIILTGAFFGEANQGLIQQSLAVASYAFLGSFIWSSFSVTVRLFNNDLVPSVYYRAGLRMILAVVIALIISFLVGEEGASNVFQFKSSLMAIAFLAGMFPERFLTYLTNLFKRFVNPDGLNTDELSLHRIEGISLAHKERLEEIGIDNAQNLATYSLTQMCLETPYEARTLLDWIGQAKLLCYVKTDIDKLRNVGIRSVFDLVHVRRTDNELGYMADAAGISEVLLRNLNEQVLNDRGILALAGFQDGVNTPEPDTVLIDTTVPVKEQRMEVPVSNVPVGRIETKVS